ncbi:MAG: GNAT family N-acetyltransferase [Promethearchaeota archaeon]
MVYLKELSKKDIPLINKWRNDPEVIDFLGGPFRYINIEIEEAWFETYLKNRDKQVRCSIFLDSDEKLIGLVSLLDIDHISKSAEFHIMIGDKKNYDKGYGTEATKLMLNHAFNNLNLNRIYLKVLEDNLRAIKIYDKCGFKKEGVLRSAVYKNGSYKNLIIMSILKKEFVLIK